jgi:hypothetical protein
MLKDNIPDITLTTSDLQIGAVEIKNATTDDRAVVQAASSTADTTVALAVADGNLHTSLGAVGAAADAYGVLHGQLYYLNGKLDALATDMAKLEARIAQPNMLVAPSSIAIDTTTARVTGLTVGTTYMVYTSAPCFIEVGPDNVEAATTNTYIEPGMVFCWTPTADNTDDGIAAIAAVAGGKVYVQACQA